MCVLRGGLNFPPLFLFREGVSNIYNMRKLKYNWTDEELIEWCKTKTMRSELKRENNTKFKRVIQRGLEDHLPKYEGRWALRTMDPEAKAEIMKIKTLVQREFIGKDLNIHLTNKHQVVCIELVVQLKVV